MEICKANLGSRPKAGALLGELPPQQKVKFIEHFNFKAYPLHADTTKNSHNSGQVSDYIISYGIRKAHLSLLAALHKNDFLVVLPLKCKILREQKAILAHLNKIVVRYR